MKYLLTFIFLFAIYSSCAQNFEVYVSDAGNFNAPPWQILKFDQNGQNPVVYINSNLNWPQDILFMEDSNVVLISNLGTGKISRYNITNGAYINDFASGISGPTRIKIGPDGFLYVLQWSGNGRVRRYALNGSYLGEFTTTGVPQSIGMDWDTNGNLYVSSYTGDLVRKYDANGADLGLFINSNLVGPTNLWFESNGDLLISDYDGTSVKRFDANGNFVGNFLTGLSQSEGFAYLPNGNLLIGNGATSSVKMFDDTGNYLQDFILNGSGNLITPNAIVVRDVTGLSIPESNNTFNVLYPSLGSEFYISPAFDSKIESIILYNITGSIVKIITELNKNHIINGASLSEGLYFVKINLKAGNTILQKLIVVN